MDILAEIHLGYRTMHIDELIGKRGKEQKTMRDVPIADVAEYAGEDADITLQLKRKLLPMLEEKGGTSLFQQIEVPLMPVLAHMERNGIRVDVEFLQAYSKALDKDMQLLEQQVYESAGENFGINSPKQLGVILFEKLKIDDKPQKTKTGQYATNEEVLAELAHKHPIVGQILDYRELQKLKSTYVDALPKLISPIDGLIHTSYNQTVAATGRLSSTDPNLQNIPIRTDKGKEIRRAFVPRSEAFVLLSADYSQVELRIMAAFSKDEAMIEAFRQGRDIHVATASKVFKVPLEQVDGDMRRKAKTANFGIIYGISAHGLSQRLNIPRKEASDIINAYFAEFPSIKNYMDSTIAFAREHGYVETLFGRRRYLRDINSRNFNQRSFAERNAINSPIQGTAADIIKVAMIRVHEWMMREKLQSKLLLQVHDELVFDAHKSEVEMLRENIARLMREAANLEVPLEVESGIGQNWLEAH
jgi:DNA polymerase-1